MTGDRWHVICDMWHVVGGEHSLKILAPYLLLFVIYDIMKIWRTRMNDWLNQSINQLINYKAVCRTAPATPGLLKM